MRCPVLHALEAGGQHCRTATTHCVQVVSPHHSGALQSFGQLVWARSSTLTFCGTAP